MAARRLELHSVNFMPEQFALVEGARAALAVAVPLGLALSAHQAWLGWAVFAAFWTCLCDTPGPDALRRRRLGLFVVCGGAIAFVGSWSASLAPAAGMIAGPLLVFLAVFLSSGVTNGAQLGTLLAVVSVVAAGFGHPFALAAVQGAAFVGGAAWAFVLITIVWPLREEGSLRRSASALVARLGDMTLELIALGDGPHGDSEWHHEYPQHRRAVRIATERLSEMIDRYGHGPALVAARYSSALNAAETLFGALIALDHAFIHHLAPDAERRKVARAVFSALAAIRGAIADGDAAGHTRLRYTRGRLEQLRGTLSDPLMTGCTLALCEALDSFAPEGRGTAEPSTAAAQPRLWRGLPGTSLRQALRQAIGVGVVYYTALMFHLGYPYWATMAVVVVLQSGFRATWTRSIERVLGSLLGGMAALALLHLLRQELALSVIAVALSMLAIALRTFNYTIFVVFLTMLFVIVAEMLQPGTGIASARMIDNLVGSFAALLSVTLLWPDFGPPLRQRIADGLEANRRYRDEVRRGDAAAIVDDARRRAGLASVEAEVAFTDVFGRLFRREPAAIAAAAAMRDMRTIAGEAAVAWHMRKAQPPGAQ